METRYPGNPGHESENFSIGNSNNPDQNNNSERTASVSMEDKTDRLSASNDQRQKDSEDLNKTRNFLNSPDGQENQLVDQVHVDSEVDSNASDSQEQDIATSVETVDKEQQLENLVDLLITKAEKEKLSSEANVVIDNLKRVLERGNTVSNLGQFQEELNLLPKHPDIVKNYMEDISNVKTFKDYDGMKNLSGADILKVGVYLPEVTAQSGDRKIEPDEAIPFGNFLQEIIDSNKPEQTLDQVKETINKITADNPKLKEIVDKQSGRVSFNADKEKVKQIILEQLSE